MLLLAAKQALQMTLALLILLEAKIVPHHECESFSGTSLDRMVGSSSGFSSTSIMSVVICRLQCCSHEGCPTCCNRSTSEIWFVELHENQTHLKTQSRTVKVNQDCDFLTINRAGLHGEFSFFFCNLCALIFYLLQLLIKNGNSR